MGLTSVLEARAYAVARHFKPLLVNTVVGFIGPEYLFDGKQITRAGLEDHFCGKLLGVPMGVDVCYTNHAEADQDDADALLALLVASGVNFVMGVPGAVRGQPGQSGEQVTVLHILGAQRHAGYRQSRDTPGPGGQHCADLRSERGKRHACDGGGAQTSGL